MPKVTAYPDCGCAILESGSRTWCPSCEAMSKAKEGWGVVTSKKAHYYRDTFSLCRKRGFYTGPLEADDKPTPDDCAQCRRKLDAEQRKGKAT